MTIQMKATESTFLKVLFFMVLAVNKVVPALAVGLRIHFLALLFRLNFHMLRHHKQVAVKISEYG